MATWCRPPPSAADLSRRPRPARHRPGVPGLREPADRVGDVTVPARVWALGRSTQRERRRRRHRAGVGRLASPRGAMIRRLALEVMWPHAPSAVPTCRQRSAPVTTCRHPLPGGSLSARPAARGAGRPGRAATRHGGAGTGLGRALAQNLHKVGPAAALGATASAPGGMAAAECTGLPHHMVRTDGPHVARVQADQTVQEHKVTVERADGTERESCSAGLPHADSLHSEPVASPRARLGGGSRWPERKGPVEFLYSPLVDWVDTPEEKYARREMQALLSSTLHELKPIDKRVTVLSYLEGLSTKEIATTVGLTVSAVKTRLHRARCFLRERLFQVCSNANLS